MTPIERVRRNRDMLDLSRRMARPKGKAAPFPRNSSSLAIFLLLVMFLVVKAALEPSVENILGYGLVFSAYGMGFLSVHYGLRHKAIYDANVVARRHKLPFNLIGAAVVGAASSSLVWLQDGSFLQGLVVLPVVTALMLLCYGLDPRKTKGLDTQAEVNLHEAENLVASVGAMREQISNKAASLAVPEVMNELRNFDEAVEALLDAAVRDPSRVRSLRRYFSVYLTGIADAADKFAAVFSGTGDLSSLEDFVELLKKMSQSYRSRALEYAQAGKSDLDVEMSVLHDYLRA